MNVRLIPILPLAIGSLLTLPPNAATAQNPASACALVPLKHGVGDTVVVPVGFDPVHASDEQLSCYGFPSRPHDPIALANWDHIMLHAKHYVMPSIAARHGPSMALPSDGGPRNGYLWTDHQEKEAGTQAPVAQANGNYDYWTAVSQEWNQPQMTFSNSQQWWAIWDGIRDGAFPQAGTQQFYGDPGPKVYWADSCVGQQSQFVSGISVATGDLLYVETAVGSYQNGQDTIEFYFNDETSGKYYPVYEKCANSVGAAGQFALEVNDNLETIGSGTFADFTNQLTYLSSSNQSGYINSFNWKDFVIENLKTNVNVACPTQNPVLYGDYDTFYNDNSECTY